MFLTVFSTYSHTDDTVRNIPKIDQIETFGLSKKAAVVSNFCLILENLPQFSGAEFSPQVFCLPKISCKIYVIYQD